MRVAVIGNGMAGIRLAEELLALRGETAPSPEITIFGAEPGGAYSRILLTPLLAGELEDAACTTHDLDWYRTRGVALQSGCRIAAIDRAARRVIGADGRVTDYDRLALALGGRPIALTLPGADLPGIMTYRDRADTRALIAASAAGGRAVVVGGGLLGIEAAAGLARRGLSVTIVHLMDRLMERQLDGEAAGLVARALAARGIALHLRAETAAFHGGDRVTAVELRDGRVLPADLVVTAVGVRPETALAQAAGLDCGRGIRVDDRLATSDPEIFAIGECVEHAGQTYGLVGPIYEQAAIAAKALMDLPAQYRGSTTATSLKVSGIPLFSAGNIAAADTTSVIFRDPASGAYRRLMLREQDGDTLLVGAILVGAIADGPWYAELIAAATPLGTRRQDLIFGRAFTEPGLAA